MKKVKPSRKTAVIFLEEMIDKEMWQDAMDFIAKYKVSKYTHCHSTLTKRLRLKENEIEKLEGKNETDNPYYKCAAPMRLYLIAEIKKKYPEKWKNQFRLDKNF